jgi:hypothetical protein
MVRRSRKLHPQRPGYDLFGEPQAARDILKWVAGELDELTTTRKIIQVRYCRNDFMDRRFTNKEANWI